MDKQIDLSSNYDDRKKLIYEFQYDINKLPNYIEYLHIKYDIATKINHALNYLSSNIKYLNIDGNKSLSVYLPNRLIKMIYNGWSIDNIHVLDKFPPNLKYIQMNYNYKTPTASSYKFVKSWMNMPVNLRHLMMQSNGIKMKIVENNLPLGCNYIITP